MPEFSDGRSQDDTHEEPIRLPAAGENLSEPDTSRRTESSEKFVAIFIDQTVKRTYVGEDKQEHEEVVVELSAGAQKHLLEQIDRGDYGLWDDIDYVIKVFEKPGAVFIRYDIELGGDEWELSDIEFVFDKERYDQYKVDLKRSSES